MWISIGVAFSLVVLWWFGGPATGEYISGYLIEKSLSIDNVFVWALIMSYFAVPSKYQHRVLFWGIFGALVMRAIFIFAGVALIERFDWILYVFGAFLLFTAGRMVFGDDEHVDPGKSRFLKLVNRVVPSTDKLDGPHLFTRINGRRLATPLFAVLVLVEVTDVIFAVDSVPAVLAVSHEQFIVFSSNAFAILGLRALYFLLADMHARFTLPAAGPGGHPRLRRREDDHRRVVPHPDVGLAGRHRRSCWRCRSCLSIRSAAEPEDDGRRRRTPSDERDGPRARRGVAAVAPSAEPADGDRRRRHRAAALDGVDRRRRRPVRHPAQGRAQLGRAVPVPRREDAVVQRPRGDRALQVLRLRQVGRRVHVRPGERARRLRRRRRVPGGEGRACSSPTRRRGQSRERARRKRLVEAMATAVEWYHQRLLDDPGGPGGPRLPALAGARAATSPGTFKLGWAPDDWDALAAAVGHRRRAAAGDRAGVHQPAQPDAGRVPGAGAVPDLLRHRRGGRDRRADPARLATTRRSTRTRRRRRSTPSRRRSTG